MERPSMLVHAEDLSSSPLGPGKTCPVRRTGERPKTCEVREDWCGSPVFRGPRNPLPPGRCAARVVHLCWSEPESRSGGGRESNPPGDFRPPTDFEGMSGLLARLSSGTVPERAKTCEADPARRLDRRPLKTRPATTSSIATIPPISRPELGGRIAMCTWSEMSSGRCPAMSCAMSLIPGPTY